MGVRQKWALPLLLIPVMALFTERGVMAGNLERAKVFFNGLDKDHLGLVYDFYDKNVVFEDPVHRLVGVEAIKSYYAHQYKTVHAIRFEFIKGLENQNEASFSWRMILRSPSLQSGQEIVVNGASFFTFGGSEGKVVLQRDYFDTGEFVYERIPVLKSLIYFIKRKLAGPG